METPQKLSSLLYDILVKRKWGAAFCAFFVYSVLRFVFDVAVLAVVLISKLYLLFTSQLSLAFFLINCIFIAQLFVGAFFSGWSLRWLYKKNAAAFRAFYKMSIAIHLPYACAGFYANLPYAASFCLFAAMIAFAVLLNRYINKAAALKHYFGEE